MSCGLQLQTLFEYALQKYNRKLITFLIKASDLQMIKLNNDNWLENRLVYLCMNNFWDVIEKYGSHFLISNDVLRTAIDIAMIYSSINSFNAMFETGHLPRDLMVINDYARTDNLVWLLEKGLISQKQCFENLSTEKLRTIAAHIFIQPDF